MPDPLSEIKAAMPAHCSVTGYLDQGGQGAVFEGTHNGHRVAIKLFDPRGDNRRLDREIELLKAIRCKHLVSIVDTFEIQLSGSPVSVVVYEFLSGGDLRKLPPRPPLKTLVKIGADVCNALSKLWALRIVHRDIKPHNIMRSDPAIDHFVLVDLGLARHLDRSDITAAGRSPGTPGYMSPEQATGRRNLTIKSDIFSLGLTLYTLAAAKHPFDNKQHLIGTTSPVPLRTLRTDLDESFCKMIAEMMAVRAPSRPDDCLGRFQSFAS